MEENSQTEVADMDVELVKEEPAKEQGLSPDKVNQIVKKAKYEAAEKARREAQEQYEAKLAQLQQKSQTASPTEQIDIDSAYQKLEEKFNQERERKEFEQQMQVVADKYYETESAAKQKFADYDDVMAEFNAQEFPELIVLLSGVDNADEVLYELGKNSNKLANIDYLARRSPKLAQRDLRKLSESIKANQAAMADSNTNRVSEPLDRLQSSNVSGSNGKKTISDLRRADWLKV